METLAWGMGFDRVLLLLKQPNKQSLVGRLLLGDNCNTDPQAIVRPLGRDANPYAVEARAFDESRPIFLGDGVLDDGWPIAALPVGIGDRAIGVIYGDMTSKDDSAELSEQHKAAIGVLSELLDRAIGLNSFKSAGRRQNG